MKQIALVIAVGALVAGCNQHSDTDLHPASRNTVTMNEPAGSSTKSNSLSGSTFNGQEGGSASSMSGEAPSGSRSPGPIEKTQPGPSANGPKK
jgi:hypothetical protein